MSPIRESPLDSSQRQEALARPHRCRLDAPSGRSGQRPSHWIGESFRRRYRFRRGRGGRGKAIRCSSPAPGLLCLTPFCAASRPPPGRCAPAWRFRAPRRLPKSCASTAGEGPLRDLRFAIGEDASPRGKAAVAVARPRRSPTYVPRRPSRQSGGGARPGSAGPKLARFQSEALRRRGRSGLSRRLRGLPVPGRPSGRSRNPRPLAVRPRQRHPAAPATTGAANRDPNPQPGAAVARQRSPAKPTRARLAEARGQGLDLRLFPNHESCLLFDQ
jgi:hypothetical protein